jgi:hypothetical protein
VTRPAARAARAERGLAVGYFLAPLVLRSTLCLILLLLGARAAASATPEWRTANEIGKKHNIVIAVCIPDEEIVCVGFGCRDAYRFDFVEMIVGDWLEGPTRLDAAEHTTMVAMSADELASREMNMPVSRGYVDAAFVARMVGHTTVQVDAAGARYSAIFPLRGFDQAYATLRNACDSAAQSFRDR